MERTARTDHADHLRRDCLEALQKESRARQEHDNKVVEDVARRLADWRDAQKGDIDARDEALEQLEEAVLELREGLEAHTHEIEVEGPRDGVNVSVQRVLLEGRRGQAQTPSESASASDVPR